MHTHTLPLALAGHTVFAYTVPYFLAERGREKEGERNNNGKMFSQLFCQGKL